MSTKSQASERLVPSWWLCGDHWKCGLAGESMSLGVLSKSKGCAILSLPSLPPVYGSRCELSGAALAACHLLPPFRHHRLLSLWNQKPETIPSFSKKPWPTKKSLRQKLTWGNDCHCEGPCFVEGFMTLKQGSVRTLWAEDGGPDCPRGIWKTRVLRAAQNMEVLQLKRFQRGTILALARKHSWDALVNNMPVSCLHPKNLPEAE